MRTEFQAAFPTTQGAIRIEGGEGGCDRIQLDCYGMDILVIKALRGKTFKVILTDE